MAERSSQGGSSGVLLGAMAGAVLGAAGLAWWLLSEADRRRQRPGRAGSHTAAGTATNGTGYVMPDAPAPRPLPERDLHDKVHELNQAIDDVRRQLESLSTGS